MSLASQLNNGPTAEQLAPQVQAPAMAQPPVNAPPPNQPAPTKRSASGQVFSNTSSGNIHHIPVENGLDYRHGGSGNSGPSSSSSQQSSTTIR